ncbi:glycosyltransferase family 2 protein [Sedimentibacter saalensis]|uniref:Glycosyltransferase involved in cell wall biosynthesis n=1 Tax=Sedimentibacter saalensis TaxID=130788 RepID=A0A562J8X7_9FIRM|nr:glycosyltransferase family 2 protein [Sedimentibacter saalensis]TWH79374.1 glycosyltransferase involved in cell wall biosynthesis [Sedimentibacter saalensis]
MADLTAIILTKNESKNIIECLTSIKNLAKRAVIIDSGSDDNTIELAKQLGADVYVHPFENYARQFNWGLDNANISTKWVLRIDADERFTPELCKKVERMIEIHDSDDINGFTLEAWLYFMGKRLEHGGGRKRKLMIFKYGIGRIEDRKMDEHTILSTGRSIALKEKFVHYDFKNLDLLVSKYNWYATREMQDYYEYQEGISRNELNLLDEKIYKTRKKKYGFYYKIPSFLRAWMLFVYNYIFRLGFLDGKEGYIYHFLYSFFYRSLVDAKIYEQKKTNAPFKETGDLK